MALADLAARTLRACGLSPVALADLTTNVNDGQAAAIVTPDDIAARALRMCGINPNGLNTTFSAQATATCSIVDIATQSLIKLGVISPIEATPAIDLNQAEIAANQVFYTLNVLGIFVWSANAIPVWAETALVQMTMAVLGSAYGKPQEAAQYESGLMQLWRYTMSGPFGQAVALSAMTSVHVRLVGLGLVDWNLGAIPAYSADSYVPLVAAELMPAVGGEFAAVSSGTAYTTSSQSSAAAATSRMQLVSAVNTAASAAMETFRRFVYSGAYGASLATDKISAVHEGLNAQGLVSWSIGAVPASYAEDYVALAAERLWAVVSPDRDPAARQTDQAASEAAVGRIRKGAEVAGAQALAESRVATAYGELVAANLITYPISAIPEPVADAIVQMTTNSMQASFGGKFDPDAYAMSIKRVRAVAMGGPVGQALAEQKVRSVHADLDARGQIVWSLFDLPDYAEEPYVMLAADLLAPEAGAKADPMWRVLAEKQLHQQAALSSAGRPVRSCYF